MIYDLLQALCGAQRMQQVDAFPIQCNILYSKTQVVESALIHIFQV
jgi:hypothetical protein